MLTTVPTANRYVEFLIPHFSKYIIRLVFMFLYPRKQSFGSRGIKELPYPSVCAKFVPPLYGHVIQKYLNRDGVFFLGGGKVHISEMCILLMGMIGDDTEYKGQCNTPWLSCHRYTNILELSPNKTCNICHITLFNQFENIFYSLPNVLY